MIVCKSEVGRDSNKIITVVYFEYVKDDSVGVLVTIFMLIMLTAKCKKISAYEKAPDIAFDNLYSYFEFKLFPKENISTL